METASHLTMVKKNVSLRETVTLALRAAVISGEMKPGEVYSAPALGKRFGVSPTPVREAMLDLAKEGLVTSLPNKGFRVTEVSDEDLDEITALRLLIEPPTVRQVTPLIDDAGLARLRQMADAIVGFAVAGDLIQYTEADRAFHIAILEYSGNKRLVALISELRAHTRLLGLAPLAAAGTLQDSAQEHVELVELIAAGKAAEAQELMTVHIGHVRTDWARH
ncbi:DNA-binding GntR family transcriptional regulator [Arthrobacter stackebrandtii]|uniref:DNA-binding GntR family transcriptional regulator n=1 Tax=Arthrobacter stackebrandtii TaxID=272161 RepID=A0ABS4YVJ6_9MICC|nr:GntR family transcriptional regulator [Arthrobacter stackebrandtii]MBP2412826.1 DNA-binding GntR family transcriptional regulator [Arthrobacter stackebrandtii]PYH01353.1 GntR family transcriptional regulator [Arthrobacter stackebrandtii]